MGADAAWGESSGPVRPNPPPARAKADEQIVEQIAALLENGKPTALLLEHHAATPAALEAAGRIAAKTGCRLLNGTFPARVDGGPGRIAVERLPYFPEQVLAETASIKQLVLVGGDVPVSFFAYQDVPGQLIPDGCAVSRLTAVEEDAIDALERLAERVGAAKAMPRRFERSGDSAARRPPEHPEYHPGHRRHHAGRSHCLHRFGRRQRGRILSARAPRPIAGSASPAAPSGQGGPVATGAALACPDRPVLALLGDGGAAYTNQSFWTQAREGLNVTTVIFANRTYNILNVEYSRLGITETGKIAASLFDIGKPDLDWVKMAAGFGVPRRESRFSRGTCGAAAARLSRTRTFSDSAPMAKCSGKIVEILIQDSNKLFAPLIGTANVNNQAKESPPSVAVESL